MGVLWEKKLYSTHTGIILVSFSITNKQGLFDQIYFGLRKNGFEIFVLQR